MPSPDSDKCTCVAIDLDIQEVTAVDVGARHMAQSLVSIDKLFKEASRVFRVERQNSYRSVT